MLVNMDPTLFAAGGAAAQSASPGAGKNKMEEDRLLTACRDFEALLWHQILRQMRRSIPPSDLLDGGMGEDIFQDFLDEEYSRLLARPGTGSLAHMLYEQLK